MTRSKLSASDREELIRLFKETTETITSLANRFQVSVSTARRVLKIQLSAEEYEAIVANRMEGRQQRKSSPKAISAPVAEEAVIEDVAGDIESGVEEQASAVPRVARPKRRSRRRTSAPEESIEDNLEPAEEKQTERRVEPPILAVAEEPDADPLEILPIASAALPNQCYLVVDRAAELITPPLKEFAELGVIPVAEESAKTLPIFANHKIASRFSRRSQRIIKIPDSTLLKKTYPMLTAKGVERILFDGQVFSLAHSS